jgi:multidrug efflux pump subunit AcrA (membrane-fusion protein)
MSPRSQGALAAFLVVAAAAVVWSTRGSEPAPEEAAEAVMEEHDHAAMMAGTGQAQPVRLSAEGARRIGITFAMAEERSLARAIATVGRVTYDETRLSTVTPRIEGWVEHLYVDFTGASVRSGDALLDLYSPRLVAAQEELILARKLTDAAQGRASGNAQDLLVAARRRLAYWDVGEEEIRAIEESGEIRRTITLRAPSSGIVIEKNVVEGDRVGPATNLFRIADLDRVWVEADVYEKDLSLVEAGLEAIIDLEAHPGRVFIGSVSYVYPTVSMAARTGSVRVEMDNPGLTLKPGMYANLRIGAPPREPRIIIPRSAVLATGTRSIVFVVDQGGTLVPRGVTTGIAFGEEIEVLRGLEAGEYVVSSASFLIDAESNLGSSMENMDVDPGGGMPPTGDPNR